jgi:uncharacterized membrane protein YraQ (UPF0718 family)
MQFSNTTQGPQEELVIAGSVIGVIIFAVAILAAVIYYKNRKYVKSPLTNQPHQPTVMVYNPV